MVADENDCLMFCCELPVVVGGYRPPVSGLLCKAGVGGEVAANSVGESVACSAVMALCFSCVAVAA